MENINTEIKRQIPIDSNNEQYLLGHAISNKTNLEILVNESDTNSFLYKNHRALFECIKTLYDSQVDVDVDTINSTKASVDGGDTLAIEYLTKLTSIFTGNVSSDNYRYNLKKLFGDKIKDDLTIKHLPSLANLLIDPKTPLDDILNSLESIKDIVEDNSRSATNNIICGALEAHDEYAKALDDREKGLGFYTSGYDRLDALLTDGLAPTKMSIVAGRTSMGKSALLCNMFLRLGMQGIPVAFFNFEMDTISMFDRLVAITAKIPLVKLIRDRKNLTYEERQAEKDALETIKALPIFFYNASTQSLEGIRRDVKMLKERHGVKIVGYDLFDKIKFNHKNNRSTADVYNQALKQIQGYGRDLKIHQILVVQIGRSAEKRAHKVPMLSELKDAGGFEERADNVFFLYRPSYYNQADEEMSIDPLNVEEIQVIVAKQRQGAQNKKAILDFYPNTTAISEPIFEDKGN